MSGGEQRIGRLSGLPRVRVLGGNRGENVVDLDGADIHLGDGFGAVVGQRSRESEVRGRDVGVATHLEQQMRLQTLGLAVVVRRRRRAAESLTGSQPIGGHQLTAAGQAMDQLRHTGSGYGGAVLADDGSCTGEHQALLGVALADGREAAPRRDRVVLRDNHALVKRKVPI